MKVKLDLRSVVFGLLLCQSFTAAERAIAQWSISRQFLAWHPGIAATAVPLIGVIVVLVMSLTAAILLAFRGQSIAWRIALAAIALVLGIDQLVLFLGRLTMLREATIAPKPDQSAATLCTIILEFAFFSLANLLAELVALQRKTD